MKLGQNASLDEMSDELEWVMWGQKLINWVKS